MNFASDNASGASSKILAALASANDGSAMPYGADDWTTSASAAICSLFERDCAVFLVPTGTAANALALACLCPPWGAIFCHEGAHILNDECGAPEFYTGGAKLIPLPGARGKITPNAFAAALRAYPRGLVKQAQPSTLSLTQATESGTLYSLENIAELAAQAHASGVHVHMDGARFANAIVSLGATPAQMTWKAGVDVLCFGASKNGALYCEAVIFFNKALAADFAFRRKRGGHTLSKARYAGAQLSAYLENGHWLELAGAANAKAARLAQGLAALPGVRLPWACEVNEIFAIVPRAVEAALLARGARFYNWGARGLEEADKPGADEAFLRLVASFAATDAEIDEFLAIAANALPAA